MDDQPKFTIDVRQGENQVATMNHSLGKFTIEDLPKGKAGTVRTEVTFKIDANCILTVTTKTNGQTNAIEIKPDDHIALTEEEVERMMAAGQFMRDKINFGQKDE